MVLVVSDTAKTLTHPPMQLKKLIIRYFALAAITLCAISNAHAQQELQDSHINVNRGEKWWGAFVGNAPEEPFAEPFEILPDTAVHKATLAPMFISSTGRYIWSEWPVGVRFDGKEFVITSPEGDVKAQRGGRTLRDAYLVCRHRNFPPPGNPVSGELYSLPVFETELEFGFMQSAEAIIDYARQLRQIGIEQGIIVLADGWSSMDGSLDFDRNFYAAPQEFVKQLHQLGFKLMLNITPYRTASGRGYVEAMRNGTLLRDRSGAPIFVNGEMGFFAVCDVTQRECRNDIEQKLKRLTEQYGVDGFRFDCEQLSRTLAGRTSLERTFLDAWCSLGADYALAEYIPGTANLERYAPGRVTSSSNEAYAYINDMLTAGLMGVSSAYADTPEIDLAKADDLTKLRTLQQELMMPMARVGFAPWRIKNKELFEEYMRNLQLRCSMGEHLRQVADEGCKTAEPMARHMEYLFPRSGFADCSTQYMLGNKYLIAPADNHAKRMVRLPRGVWTDTDGRRYRGPVVINADTSNGKLLCFELN